MGHFVNGISRDVQPKGCDVTVLNYVRRRHTRERVPNIEIIELERLLAAT